MTSMVRERGCQGSGTSNYFQSQESCVEYTECNVSDIVASKKHVEVKRKEERERGREGEG